MKKYQMIIPAAALSISLLAGNIYAATTGGSSADSTKTYYDQDKEHVDITLDQVPRDSFDEQAYRELAEEMRTLMQEEGQEKKLLQDYDALEESVSHLSTDYSILTYDHYLDPSNEESESAYEKMESLETEITDDFSALLRDLLTSDYGDAITEKMGEDTAELYRDYSELTDRQKELTEEMQEVVRTYDNQAVQEPETQAAHDTWVLSQKKLYCRLLGLEAEMAETLDADDYYSSLCEEDYNRDYSSKDSETLAEEVRTYLPSLMQFYLTEVCDTDALSEVYASENLKAEEEVAMLQPCLEQISGELAEAFDYMEKNHLYDMNTNERKMAVGFTSTLEDYGSAYIFDCPEGYLADFKTLVHEFGHYAHAYGTEEGTFGGVANMDVCEIHSQGLELLCYPFYTEIMGDEELGEGMRAYVVYNMFYAIELAFCVDEFERTAMKDPDMTVKELDALADSLGQAYGVEESFGADNWFYISHIYEQPGYYIAYGTSALAALEIFRISQEDYDKACDIYMQLSASSARIPYCQALENVGLDSPFEKDGVKKLCQELEDNWLTESAAA